MDSLGVYDSGQDGLVGSAQVGLWLASGGNPLVQTTVASGTAGELDGYFRFTAIAPTTLNPGTEYIVGSYISEELATALFGGNGTVDPYITVIDVRYSSTGVFAFPDLTDPDTEGCGVSRRQFSRERQSRPPPRRGLAVRERIGRAIVQRTETVRSVSVN